MLIKNKRILVTGGAGFIGSHLVDSLVKKNQVTIIDNFSTGEAENLKEASKSGNLKVIKEDIVNMLSVKKAMENIDIIFHLAVKGVRESINSPMPVHETNSLGTLNLCIVAREKKVERFIHISSSEIYGSARYVPMDENHPFNPETVYGASKLAGEFYGLAYFRTYNLPVTIIRPFNTYGPRSHFAGVYGEVIPRFVVRVLNNLPPVVFGDGKQTRDFTFIDDTVRGMMLAAENDDLVGSVINIAYGKERSINDVAKIVLKLLDKKELGVKYEERRPGDVGRHYADVKKAKKMLNFEAKTSLEDGIEQYISWLRTQDFNLKEMLKQIKNKNW